jgi:hypothetical protein
MRTTIIGGRVVMQDREFADNEEGETLAKARTAVASHWKRF